MTDLIAWFVCTVCALGSCVCSNLTFRNFFEASLVTGDKREERNCWILMVIFRVVFVIEIIFCLLWLLALV